MPPWGFHGIPKEAQLFHGASVALPWCFHSSVSSFHGDFMVIHGNSITLSRVTPWYGASMALW